MEDQSSVAFFLKNIFLLTGYVSHSTINVEKLWK